MLLVSAFCSENCPFKFQVINRIKKSCGDINEVELAKLGVALLNCQSKSEGRRTYECTDEMVSVQSSESLNPSVIFLVSRELMILQRRL